MKLQSNMFVYGTLMLASGHPMGKRLSSEADFIGPASVQGLLYDLGKWPGLVLSDNPKEQVKGEIWALRCQSSFYWLDEYEGLYRNVPETEYARVPWHAFLNGRSKIPVSLYLYRWSTAGAPLIASGSWLDRCAAVPMVPLEPPTQAPVQSLARNPLIAA